MHCRNNLCASVWSSTTVCRCCEYADWCSTHTTAVISLTDINRSSLRNSNEILLSAMFAFSSASSQVVREETCIRVQPVFCSMTSLIHTFFLLSSHSQKLLMETKDCSTTYCIIDGRLECAKIRQKLDGLWFWFNCDHMFLLLQFYSHAPVITDMHEQYACTKSPASCTVRCNHSRFRFWLITHFCTSHRENAV